MNLGDLKRRVSNVMGDASTVFVEPAQMVDILNDAQLDIVRKTEFLRTSTLISTIVGTAEYALPSNFIVEKRVTYNNITMYRTTTEKIDDFDLARDDVGSRDIPYYYYISGGLLGVYPVPSSAVNNVIKVYYVRTPIALAADGDIPEIPVYMHEDLVRYTCARFHEQAEQYDIANTIMGEYEKRLTLSIDQTENASARTYPVIRDRDRYFEDTYSGWA